MRQTPLTLMLHRSHSRFDAVAFLRDFIVLVQQADRRVVTYREIAENPTITATEQGKLVIFTIDDIYLRYPMDPSVREMIALLKEAGFPAVLGIVTEGDYAYPETVATLNELTALGWEVASHSDTHRNLREIQKISPKAIYPEIKTSLDKLEKALGQRPITLILPEGQMTQGDQQLKRANLLWIVGINGGVTYETDATYYYVGREGPAGDAATTFSVMLKRFAP
jgi:peptidoglycan/xylan/chitin deacetylase (PgdA/CDA1 family)